MLVFLCLLGSQQIICLCFSFSLTPSSVPRGACLALALFGSPFLVNDLPSIKSLKHAKSKAFCWCTLNFVNLRFKKIDTRYGDKSKNDNHNQRKRTQTLPRLQTLAYMSTTYLKPRLNACIHSAEILFTGGNTNTDTHRQTLMNI